MSKTFERVAAYPLAWPYGFPVYKSRENSKFQTTLTKALGNVQDELERFAKDSGKKISDLVISSNYNLSTPRPENPGVAVYFTWDGERTCIPVDKYNCVEDNLQAIYHILNAKRTQLRHGGLNMVKAEFRWHLALPAPKADSWRETLDYYGHSLDVCKEVYRKAISAAHPDRQGGSDALAAKVNNAWAQAQIELTKPL
jgi:hypothetical protein